MFEKIDDLINLGISIKFNREIGGFKIELANSENKKEMVVLPYDHLTENKIIKYINLMQTNFII